VLFADRNMALRHVHEPDALPRADLGSFVIGSVFGTFTMEWMAALGEDERHDR
jgi:hypothetical protein